MPDFRATCIFADDVRREENDRISIMGVIGHTLTFATAFPHRLQKMAIVCFMKNIPTGKHHYHVEIAVPGVHSEEIRLPDDLTNKSSQNGALVFELSNLKFTESTQIKFKFFCDEQVVEEGILNVTSKGLSDSIASDLQDELLED